VRWLAKTADDTEALGGRLATARPKGDALATIHLSGDLGAGKTTLARGFLRASGVNRPLRSPTYTLVEVYDVPSISIVHLDLYRLVDATELEPLGLREWASSGHLWLVEWPERAAGRLPVPDLLVRLLGGPLGHEINVTATSALGESWLAAVENSSTAP